MNIPTKYGFGSTPKADNKIRIKGSTDYILLLCVILLVAIGIVMVFSSSYYTAGRGRNQAFDLRPSGASSCKGKKKRAGITA